MGVSLSKMPVNLRINLIPYQSSTVRDMPTWPGPLLPLSSRSLFSCLPSASQSPAPFCFGAFASGAPSTCNDHLQTAGSFLPSGLNPEAISSGSPSLTTTHTHTHTHTRTHAHTISHSMASSNFIFNNNLRGREGLGVWD